MGPDAFRPLCAALRLADGACPFDVVSGLYREGDEAPVDACVPSGLRDAVSGRVADVWAALGRRAAARDALEAAPAELEARGVWAAELEAARTAGLAAADALRGALLDAFDLDRDAAARVCVAGSCDAAAAGDGAVS